MLKLLRSLPVILVAALTVGPVSAATSSPVDQTIAQSSATTPPAAPATVTGSVTDSQGGPVAGAYVVMAGAGNYETHTDSKGAFTVTGVKPGLYRIAITKPGYGGATQEDVAIAPGVVSNVNAALVAATTQSLRLIGTVTTTAGKNKFNASGLSVSTLDNTSIVARVQPNLKDVVSELPGVIATRDAGGRSPNSSFQVRGANIETKVTMDGHAISSGVFGTYNNAYTNSEIFEQVEVLKGAGLNGVNAGESAFGTVNLRTRNFLPKNGFEVSASADTFGSGWINFLGNYNVGKFSFLAARSFQGYNGPNSGQTAALVGNTIGGTTNRGYVGPSLVQWQGDMSNPYSTEADLLKARYKFSGATWLTAEWLNLTGRYYNQGGSYAFNDGQYLIAQCYTGAAFIPSAGAGCTASSTYNPPWLTDSIKGTTQTLFNFFPNSKILNHEPQYSLELRTTHKNDTFFLRPYQTTINRNIDGSTENSQIGYGGGWYQVTSTANCQVVFVAAGALGAKGPCFAAANNYSAPYIGAPDPTHPVVFQTTPTAPVCTVAAPCWTSQTNAQRNGYYGYNTPFSQPEVDRLNGVTFTWLHPVGANFYTFSMDYSRDNTLKFTADNSALPAGCLPVVAGGVSNLPFTNTGAQNKYYQPACTIGGMVLPTLPATALQIPPTTNYKTDWSLTGIWQLTPRLQIGLGNYLTVQKLDYVYTDPAAALAAATTIGSNGKPQSGAEPADSTLLHGIANHVHYDPHFQMQYRVNPNLSLRATAGSSITMPYAALVSGFAKIFPNTTPTADSETLPNPLLQPESTIAYNFGFDGRTRDGSIISFDAFNNTIHNAYVTINSVAPPLPNRPAGITQLLVNQTVNGPLERDFGVELTMQKNPLYGFGYFATGTLQRAYYDGFSPTFYQNLAAQSAPGKNPFLALVNGKQLDGTGGFQGQIPYFKSKLELNYRAQGNGAYFALGTVIQGSNNTFGLNSGFNTWYTNANWNLGKNLSLTLSGENILNYGVGTFTGAVVNNGGFTVIGTRWNALLGRMENGNVFAFNDSAVIIQPRNFYLTLTKKI